jgi:hypothetical protein
MLINGHFQDEDPLTELEEQADHGTGKELIKGGRCA